MNYEKRADALSLIYAVLFAVIIIAEIYYGDVYILRGIVSVIMQIMLFVYAIMLIRDHGRGEDVIRSATTPRKDIFWKKEKPMLVYIVAIILATAVLYTVTGDLVALMIECAPLPYVLGINLAFKFTEARSEKAKIIAALLIAIFTVLYISMLCIAENDDVKLIAVVIIEFISVVSYFVSLAVSRDR